MSRIPSMDQVVGPVFFPHSSLHHEPGHFLAGNGSYFMPLPEGGLYRPPLNPFQPLSSDKISKPQTLPSISVLFEDMAASKSSSQQCATENYSQRQGTFVTYRTRSSHSEKPRGPCPTPAAASTSSISDEEPTTPDFSSSPSVHSPASTEQSHSSNIHRKFSVDVSRLSIASEDHSIPALQTIKGRRQGPASATGEDEIEDAEMYPPSLVSGVSERSYTGRLSDKGAEELAKGLEELDRVIQKIKASTGLSTKQIIKRWQPPNSRDLNLWNIYQKYFQTKTIEEIQRLPEKDRPAGGNKANMKTIQAAYKAFQQDEPNYESILETFWRIQEIDGSNTTVNGRCRDFSKYINALKKLAESASNVDGFETAFCAVGSVVHQDQSLSATFCSRMVPNFFSDRLRLSDNDIQGHLKAHAYDQASRIALSSASDDAIAPEQPVADQPLMASGNNDKTVKVKGENRRLLKVLKDKFMNLLGPCKISQLRQSHLSFSDIPKILAQNGWIMENWPENVPFPCDLKKGQGIAGLRARFRQPLLRAFDDRYYPLKVAKKYSEAVPPSEPVIIGLPPPPESEHTHGRRRFLDANQTVDRRGPARRISASGSISKDGHSIGIVKKRAKSSEGDEVDSTYCRKRRKGGR